MTPPPPPPPAMVIVLVPPTPDATTPAPTKSRVSATVARGVPSSSTLTPGVAPGMVIVLVVPMPVASTPAPTKSRVSAAVARGVPSSSTMMPATPMFSGFSSSVIDTAVDPGRITPAVWHCHSLSSPVCWPAHIVEPFSTSRLPSQSAARVHAPSARASQMPFNIGSVWAVSKTRSPSAMLTPEYGLAMPSSVGTSTSTPTTQRTLTAKLAITPLNLSVEFPIAISLSSL